MIEGQQEPSEVLKRTTRALADMYESLIISRKASNQRHYGKSQGTSRDPKGKSPFERSAAVKTKLYRQLDDLEESVNNDFERHRAETLNMSFNGTHGAKADVDGNASFDRDPWVVDTRPLAVISSGYPSANVSVKGLSDVSAHSDREILGDLLHIDNNNSNSNNGDGSGRNRSDQDRWIPDQNLVDDKYSVLPLINHPSHHRRGPGNSNRAISPGQYFGARSLPLDSFEDIWTKPQPKKNNNGHYENNNDIKEEEQKEDPLGSLFKALPKKLNHRHHHRQDNRGYTIEPERLVLSTVAGGSSSFGCLYIKSTHDTDQTFSLFSARGKLRFFPREGIVPALDKVEVMVRLRKSAMHDLNKKGGSQPSAGVGLENILLLMKGRETQQIQVDIDNNLSFENTMDDQQLSQDDDEAVVAKEERPDWRRQYQQNHKPNQGQKDQEDKVSSEQSPQPPHKERCRFCIIEQL